MKKTIYSSYIPFHVNNPYAGNVMRLLADRNVETIPIKTCLANPKDFLKCQIFNFNWFETVEKSSDYIKKVLLIAFLKLFRKKIIYTLHNCQPHDTKNKPYSIKMMKKLAKKSDIILGLCDDTMEVVRRLDEKSICKLRVVRHPNYIANYPEKPCQQNVIELKKRLGINNDDIVFLFIGAVSPYKNLEMLIRVFKNIDRRNVKLVIAGRPQRAENYGDVLKEQIADCPNVICDFRYIPDEEVPTYYEMSKIVILPYNKESSLNSGAAFLSFSLKKTIICPNIGTINSLLDKSFVYQYDYRDATEHEVELKAVIDRALNDFDSNNCIFDIHGENAFKYVSTIHSDSIISDEYREIYESLI